MYGIYGLVETGQEEIRYVGKGAIPSRPRTHGAKANISRYPHLPVVCWIEALRKKGSDYTWVTLQECPKELASSAEIEQIARLRASGVKLLNCTDGGEGMLGLTASPDLRAKRAINAQRLWADETFRARQTKLRLERWQSRQARLVHSAAQGGRPFCDENGNVYVSLHEAARQLGVSAGNIRHVLAGAYSQTGGHKFTYVKTPQ